MAIGLILDQEQRTGSEVYPSWLTGPNDSQDVVADQLPEVQAHELGCDAGDLGADADRNREWERRHTSNCSAATAQTLVEVCLILRRLLQEPPHRRQPDLPRTFRFLDFQQVSRDDESRQRVGRLASFGEMPTASPAVLADKKNGSSFQCACRAMQTRVPSTFCLAHWEEPESLNQSGSGCLRASSDGPQELFVSYEAQSRSSRSRERQSRSSGSPWS